jgi:uncharacterized protein YggT (Ycf19 family)
MNDNKIVIPGYLRISKIVAYVLYIWVLIGVISLTLRTFLLAFSANPSTPFVEFVYKTSADYLNPFRGIFPSKPIGETGYFDVASVFAIIIYLFIMWGFSSLISYVQFKIDASKKEQEKLLNQKAQAVRTAQQPRPRPATR